LREGNRKKSIIQGIVKALFNRQSKGGNYPMYKLGNVKGERLKLEFLMD